MNNEKKKKLLEFIKSNTFCNGLLISCSLIGAGISISNFNALQEINLINTLAFPLAFTVGVNGLVFIPMACDKKLREIEDNEIKTVNNDVKNNSEDIPLQIVKRTSSSKELIDTIDNILLANPHIGVKLELLPEWQEYLENTFLDPKGIKFIQELIYYLMLLNTMPVERIIPLLKDREDILDLLIHFSNNGDNLAIALNREIKDIKRERTI